MTIKKTHLAALAAVTLLTAGVISVKSVSAQTDPNGPMSSIVQKLADKFGLNKDEVQSVFDEAWKDRESQMESKYEERLDTLVTNGKITEDQKALILAKHNEMEANRQTDHSNFKSLTKEERKAEMDAKRTELENWAKENNIDVQYLMGMWGGKGHGGHGRMGPPEDQ